MAAATAVEASVPESRTPPRAPKKAAEIRQKPASPRASRDVLSRLCRVQTSPVCIGPASQGVEAKRAEARTRHNAVWVCGIRMKTPGAVPKTGLFAPWRDSLFSDCPLHKKEITSISNPDSQWVLKV